MEKKKNGKLSARDFDGVTTNSLTFINGFTYG